MARHTLLAAALVLSGLTGCDIDVPLDLAGLARPIENAIGDVLTGVEQALADPLDANPFPVLIGGNSARVFYATNLTDIRLRFPGPLNDIVLPGVFGPSNVYEFDTATKRRKLIRPLVFTSAKASQSDRVTSKSCPSPFQSNGSHRAACVSATG